MALKKKIVTQAAVSASSHISHLYRFDLLIVHTVPLYYIFACVIFVGPFLPVTVLQFSAIPPYRPNSNSC